MPNVLSVEYLDNCHNFLGHKFISNGTKPNSMVGPNNITETGDNHGKELLTGNLCLILCATVL